MIVKITQGQQHAVCGLLDHKYQAICADPRSGFTARHLALRYEEMRCYIGSRPTSRKGVVSLNLTAEDARSLEYVLEHEVRTHGNEHYAAALAAIRAARQPRPDPRRVNGRRVRQAAAL